MTYMHLIPSLVNIIHSYKRSNFPLLSSHRISKVLQTNNYQKEKLYKIKLSSWLVVVVVTVALQSDIKKIPLNIQACHL